MAGGYSTDGSRFDQHYGSGAWVLSENLMKFSGLILAMSMGTKKSWKKAQEKWRRKACISRQGRKPGARKISWFDASFWLDSRVSWVR